MENTNFLHPSDQTLNDYGLGKLDDESASTVHVHLENCKDCRQRVSWLTADSFLRSIREADKPSGRAIESRFLDAGNLSFDKAKPMFLPPSTDTLPLGLANHPDYQIKRELGRGGMGVVYLAHNAMMGRDEVLKVMGRHIMDRSGVLERFQREIRAVAKLRHSNIVAAYHAFRIEGGLVFSMEYVEGLDLSRLVKTKGPLSVAHATYFIHQAALGLQHAHEKGLIHRDIKPHNLMLTHDGKSRLVKVLDFGLAKATREEKVDGGLTTEGQALGTPDYIAPEQIVNAFDVDIRADLYSLGGTLFYLLTGRPPFQADSLYDIYQAHMSRDAEPLNLLRPEVPAELAAVVSKMMAKNPDRRFQTPAEVSQALAVFYKTVGVPRRVPKPEVSQDSIPVARQSTPKIKNVSSLPIDPRMPSATEPMPQTKIEVAEPNWTTLIDFRDPESPAKLLPPVIEKRASRQRLWARLGIFASIIGFFAVCLVISAMDRKAFRNTETPATKTIREKLEQPIALKFPEATSFSDVIGYISEATKDSIGNKMTIYVDPIGLQDVDKTLGDTVRINLEGVPLKISLGLLLRQLGLSYCVANEMLFISDDESILDWQNSPNTIEVFPGDTSTKSKDIINKLNDAIPMNFVVDTPLKDVVKWIGQATRDEARGLPDGIPIYLDLVELQRADKTPEDTVVISMQGVPLKYTLRLALRQLSLTYYVKDGILIIRSTLDSESEAKTSPSGEPQKPN